MCVAVVHCSLGDLVGVSGGTGVRELTTGLATLPKRWIHEPLVVRDRDGNPQEDPLVVHCFCVCSGSVLLGDLLGVSRSIECVHDHVCPVDLS